MENDELAIRIEVIERLTNLFKTERMVYLIATLISLFMLVGSGLSLMINKHAGAVELTMLFGSSGLITYTTGRLLFMWSEALKRLIPTTDQEGVK